MPKQKNAITPTRAENFPEWYQEVIKAADLAEHSDVRGCMVIKPWGYAIWELIQRDMDRRFKETGHQNAYFPLLIPMSFMEKEAQHVEGFAKECAVVTHHRLEDDGAGNLRPAPSAKLTEPLVIRPTSETIIGKSFARWVTSYNDLPILLNQWANIVRWEMRTRLFLRTSEFLWQEGHTAHATAEEAVEETLKMLKVYEDFVVERLAMPVIRGEKTADERFPGAVNTYSIEAMMQDGKALQSGTSHFLGQNFAKAYDVQFEDRNQQRQFAWTTSWGVSTRLIGGMIMAHSDDDGLVLPPAVAPSQVILLPIARSDDELQAVIDWCDRFASDLKKQTYIGEPVRVVVDKTNRRGGEKFWDAVKKGVPLRVEIGAREMDEGTVTLSRRDKPAKERETVSREALLSGVAGHLTDIQSTLLQRASDFRASHTHDVATLDELKHIFKGKESKVVGFARCFFHPDAEKELENNELLKNLKLTARCVPLDEDGEAGKCLFTGKETGKWLIIARAY